MVVGNAVAFNRRLPITYLGRRCPDALEDSRIVVPGGRGPGVGPACVVPVVTGPQHVPLGEPDDGRRDPVGERRVAG